MRRKKLIIIILFILIVLGIDVTLASGIQNYRDIHFRDNKGLPIEKPTAQFELTHNGTTYESPTGTDIDSFSMVVFATVGDTVSIQDKSRSNRGKSLKAWDFQYTRPDGNNQIIEKKEFEKQYTLDIAGTYTFSLCVRDTVENEAWTYYWGNWSDNGNHRVIGNNPGADLSNPSDDFDGYWYFTRIAVIVKEKSYTLQEKHIDTTTGKVLSETQHRNITENSFTTYAGSFNGYSFIGSRAGYSWDEIANGVTENISTRTADFDGSRTNAFHYYYYEPMPGLFADFAIKHGGDDYTDKELTVPSLPVTVDFEDLSLGEDIVAWKWEYKTPEQPSFQTFSFEQEPEMTLESEKTYTFRLTVTDEFNNTADESHQVTVRKGIPTQTGKSPIAVITGPAERMAGESITFSGASSTDPDGTIVDYFWNIPGSNHLYTEPSKRTTRVWYPVPGEYDLDLTVVDNDGLTGECMTSITITPPVPTAVIDSAGTFKVNRKVTVSGSNSYSPAHYPINKYTWSMTNAADARYIGTFGSEAAKDMIFKKAQSYRFDLRVDNTYGLSDTETKTVTIVPDAAPIADFSVAAQVLRDPHNSNYATITATNLSRSTDGDPIKKTVMFYAYDSDNDGDFADETWYCSKDGTTWTSTGLTYSQLDSFDLYNLNGAGNPEIFTLRTKQVGKYKFEAKTIEDIPAADTIPSLLSPDDYRTGISTTLKPLSAKIVEVLNTAPTVSFEVKKKKLADILIFTDYTGAKLNNLLTAVNIKKAQLNAIGVDPSFIIVNSSKTIGTQALNKYKYIRYLHFNVLVTDGVGTNNQWTPSNPKLFDASGDIWEETQSYEKPLNEIPFGRNYSYYQYINTTTRSSPYESVSPNYKVYDTAGGYVDVSFSTHYNYMGYFYDYNQWAITGVGPDAQWIQDAYISTDNKNVTSIDIAAIRTTPLRTGSDRYALFISDGKSKDYSKSFGDSFAFGSLTDDIRTYISQNKFKVYAVADPKAMNTLISKEIPVEVKACDARIGSNTYKMALYQTSNGYYYFYHTKTNKPYVVDMSTFGEVKSIEYPGLVIMKNGTAKFFDGSSFTALPVNNVLSVKELSYQYVAVTTTSGVAFFDTYNNMNVKAAVSVPNVVEVRMGYSNSYNYAAVGARNSAVIVNLNTGAIVRSFAQNNFVAMSIIDRESIIFADGDGIDVIRTSDMVIFRTYAISGGVKQIYPKDWFVDFNEGGTYTRGIYFLNNTGRIYRFKDANYDKLLDAASTVPSGFNSYNIKQIQSYTTASNFYFISNDNKLLYYDNSEITISVKSSNLPIVEDYSLPKGSYKDIIARLVNGSISVSYPFVVGGHWQRHGDDDPTWEYDYIQSDFYTVPMPAGVTAKKVLVSPLSGMLFIGSDNNLYQITHVSGQGVDQSPQVSVLKNGVSDVLKNNDNHLYLQLTNGNVYHKYKYDSYRNYDETLTNVNKIAITDIANTIQGTHYIIYNNGTVTGNVVTNNISMTDTTASYITMNTLVTSSSESRTYGAGQYSQALDNLAGIYTADPSYTTNYIVLGDTVDYKVLYQDYENDTKFRDYWTYSHTPGHFENPMGTASFHGQTLGSPVTTFTKTGKYTINLKVRDNPKADDRFDNYRLYNKGTVTADLYVHRLGVPVIKALITPNGQYFRLEATDGGSYDLDHISRPDKGIIQREWRWKNAEELTWHNGRMVKTDCLPEEEYNIQLRVKDVEGFWSDWKTVVIKEGNPPVALFTIEKNPLPIGEYARIKDRSYPQSFSTITRWHWIIRKLDDRGIPTTEIQNEAFSSSNNCTASDMDGYDGNVIYDYREHGTGTYRIYLRVKDSSGMWSDGGTDGSFDTENCYSQDLVIQEGFKMSGFRVVKVKDTLLEGYYRNSITGGYEDKPMGVNEMAVDSKSFNNKVGGLAKGYVFEFEIDTVNFNDDSDSIRIVPHFYTCDDYYRDPEERDLFWENSYHEVLRAGEGGHAAWSVIELTGCDRSIGEDGKATWRGSYLIPGTSWAAALGTSTANAKSGRIGRDIIVNFEIKGYKDGVMKYDYNLQQWPMEREVEKTPYEVGDVIRYSSQRSNLDDIGVILNRP